MALYRAIRLRFGYGFESCDANGPRNVKNTNLAKHRPVFLAPLFLVGSKESVLKVSKRGQFHAAIRVTLWRCDSCAQEAQWPHITRHCDTIAAIPHIARYFFGEVGTPPKWYDTPPGT